MNVRQALAQAQALGLDRLDAQMLVLHALSRDPHDRAWLWSHDQTALDEAQTTQLQTLQRRRLDGEPMAYLIGWQEFHGIGLQVDGRVLVPRADTETLVTWALQCLDRPDGATNTPRVLDLGTGSGAIALALKAARPHTEVHAVDASADALDVARANASRLGLDVRFHHGSWFEPVSGYRFDLIVSNPPYIADNDPHLPALRHEPVAALTAGRDGLEDLRHIANAAPGRLAMGGWLLLEHGHDQAVAVRQLLDRARFDQVNSRKDLAGIERCSGGRRGFDG
ncbi:MAG: peptide chain release factor N(5)-glutamine methyltransferase [Burkholderiales bacterium]|nr:MAG: peptide chain release factor N(5)-glutamine methyltransferase [Burkholderiales bacterium]